MRIQYKNILISASLLLLSPTVLFAAGNHDKSGGAYNPTLMVLAGFSLILLFVILMLANVKKQLTDICKEKIRENRLKLTTKTIVLLFITCFASLNAMAADIPKAVGNTAIIGGVNNTDFYMIMTVIVLEFLVIFALLYNISALHRVISNKAEKQISPELANQQPAKESWFWDKFNSAVTIEKEKDILLDHDYDGVQELDNSLPPWWKYGFYITIGVAIIYFFYFQVFHSGLNSREEYLAEMQQGEEQKAEYLAKAGNSVDENTVVLLTDAASLGEAKGLFVKNCSPCHLPDGGGIVGPNLTDDYWLHGGSIKDIFKTIKYGYMDKGMKSWKDDFSPKQIQELASYIKSLRGTKPVTPKAPQGELYVEATTTSTTTTTKIDSVVIKKK